MKVLKYITFGLFLCLGTLSLHAQLTYTPRSYSPAREIDPGKGQEFSRSFIDAASFHFVQFGVYPSTVDKRTIRAPGNIGQVWLIYHNQTTVKGSTANGAYYIVKPFSSIVEAKMYVERYKAAGIDCWYNEELTGAPFVLHAFTKL